MEKLAIESVGDLSKQLIALATGITGLSITFLKDVIRYSDHVKTRRPLKLSWVLYVFSLLAGVWTLMALTGTVVDASGGAEPVSIGSNVRIPASVQILLFVLATMALVRYGWVAINVSHHGGGDQ